MLSSNKGRMRTKWQRSAGRMAVPLKIFERNETVGLKEDFKMINDFIK